MVATPAETMYRWLHGGYMKSENAKEKSHRWGGFSSKCLWHKDFNGGASGIRTPDLRIMIPTL